ncbi:recombination protein RecO [Nitratiruptor sp. YY09-18]|uniref:recombination protein RecO n=1 Tax=Nitratiruptor sp. YY09-18 TaxID=2724901 RepID=UPI0019155993|nr:recombination protein RecO [Nitratiruptor sp. YY09-18]BCD67798.1 hypothetical protein NitYY0918_C0705 [Nitratiruptor sp. YY09-18]
MQGFIINVTKVKNEDLIVNVLTSSHHYTLYRFYGARHSTINLGYKIDFEIEYQIGYLPKLRHITHLGFPWLKNIYKHMVWQQFIRLLYQHLRELESVDSFYFTLCDRICKKLERQEPKRAIIEEYCKLLAHEGRLHKDFVCFVCEKKVNNPALARSFLPAHPSCIAQEPFNKERIHYLFEHFDTQFLSDKEIEVLWSILLEGI